MLDLGGRDVESELLNGNFSVGLRDFRLSVYRAAASANFNPPLARGGGGPTSAPPPSELSQ